MICHRELLFYIYFDLFLPMVRYIPLYPTDFMQWYCNEVDIHNWYDDNKSPSQSAWFNNCCTLTPSLSFLRIWFSMRCEFLSIFMQITLVLFYFFYQWMLTALSLEFLILRHSRCVCVFLLLFGSSFAFANRKINITL